MRRTKLILLILTSFFMMSCDNYLLPVVEDGSDWESTLDCIVSSNKQLFSYRGLEIVGSSKLTNVKVNADLFHSGQYSSFPVYFPRDSCFKVVSYSDLQDHWQEYGYNMHRVDSCIESILSHSEAYDVIRLDWQGQSGKYQSLALFDRRTGELEYDNMLFNMSMVRNYNTNEFSVMLSQFEVNLLTSGSDFVTYEECGLEVAKAGIRWEVYGERQSSSLVLVDEDDDYYLYVQTSRGTYNNMIISELHYTQNPNEYMTYVCYNNASIINEPRYYIDYGLWAGNVCDYDTPILGASMTSAEFRNNFRTPHGTAKLVHHMGSLNYYSDVIYVPKNH